MEPSLSFDASIVLRTAQDEVALRRARGVRCGVRAPCAPTTTMRRRPRARRRPACAPCPGAGCSMPPPKAASASTASPSAARASSAAGDVITIAGSQLLVEEATPATLALRRFDLVGNDTLPPVGDSVRVLAPPAEDLPIDLGEVPSIEGFVAPRVAQGRRTRRWNYAAWVMGGLLARGARPVRDARAHRARPAPG